MGSHQSRADSQCAERGGSPKPNVVGIAFRSVTHKLRRHRWPATRRYRTASDPRQSASSSPQFSHGMFCDLVGSTALSARLDPLKARVEGAPEASRMPSEPRSARLVLDWAAKHWAKWRTPPCPTSGSVCRQTISTPSCRCVARLHMPLRLRWPRGLSCANAARKRRSLRNKTTRTPSQYRCSTAAVWISGSRTENDSHTR
jgi:hypothetical protein